MKTKETKDKKKEPAISFSINPELNNKYNNDPFLNGKVEKVKGFLKKAGVPKF